MGNGWKLLLCSIASYIGVYNKQLPHRAKAPATTSKPKNIQNMCIIYACDYLHNTRKYSSSYCIIHENVHNLIYGYGHDEILRFKSGCVFAPKRPLFYSFAPSFACLSSCSPWFCFLHELWQLKTDNP